MTNFIDTIRAAVDNGIGIVAAKELSPYQVNLITVLDDGVTFDQIATNRTRTTTRLTVGTSVGPDLNPHIQYLTKMDSNGISVLSGGALTDMTLMLGPIAFAYNTGFQSGGLDPSVFQPGPTSNSNTQIYIQIIGTGLNQANGNYFKIAEVVLNGMDNSFYYLRLQSISDVVN